MIQEQSELFKRWQPLKAVGVHDESRDSVDGYFFPRMPQGLLMSIPIVVVPVFQHAFTGKSIESQFLPDFNQYREFADAP